jgi:hypothetical protein
LWRRRVVRHHNRAPDPRKIAGAPARHSRQLGPEHLFEQRDGAAREYHADATQSIEHVKAMDAQLASTAWRRRSLGSKPSISTRLLSGRGRSSAYDKVSAAPNATIATEFRR